MTSIPFRFELLDVVNDRTLFVCGEDVPDRYFQAQAIQDMRHRVANCVVAIEAVTGQIAAYYTLSAASIPLMDLPPDETKRLPVIPRFRQFASAASLLTGGFRGAGWERRY